MDSLNSKQPISPINPNIAPTTLPGKQKNDTEIKEEVKIATSEKLQIAGKNDSLLSPTTKPAYHKLPMPSLPRRPTGEPNPSTQTTQTERPTTEPNSITQPRPIFGTQYYKDPMPSLPRIPTTKQDPITKTELNSTTQAEELPRDSNSLTQMTSAVQPNLTAKKEVTGELIAQTTPTVKENLATNPPLKPLQNTPTSLKQKILNCSLLKCIKNTLSRGNSKTADQTYPLDTTNGKSVAHSANSIKSFHQSGVELIYSGARGQEVSATQYLMAARDLRNIQSSNPEVSITIFQLYEKAADKFMAAGELKNVLKARSEAANAVQFSNTHLLFKMTEGIKSELNTQTLPDVGLHMESGSSRVPEGLKFSTRPHEDGKNRDVLNCQLSTLARNELETKLDGLFFEKLFSKNANFEKSLPKSTTSIKELNSLKLKEFEKSLPKSMIPVKISIKEKYSFQGKVPGSNNFTADDNKGIKFPSSVYEIEFANGAKFTIGADNKQKFIHERIQVEVPSNQGEGESLKQMQQILTVLGLGTVIPTAGKQASIESERQKFDLILKTHFPQAWDKIQKNFNYDDMSLVDLKKEMIKLAPGTLDKPGIKDIFKRYEENPDLISRIEVYPGKQMWVLNDISEKMKEAGVHGLFSGTSVAGATAFLKVGQLSTNERLHGSANVTAGASFQRDVSTGGSEGIFLRAVNAKISQTAITSDQTKDFQFSGKVQVLYDLKVINRGAVCYRGDRFGTRNSTSEVYQNRENPIDFAKDLGKSMDRYRPSTPGWELNEKGIIVSEETGEPIVDPKNGSDNEVCVNGGCIGPEFIKGMLVQDQKAKQELLSSLMDKIQGIVYDGDKIVEGILVYQGADQKEIRVNINKFIYVADKFNEEMWTA